MTTTRTPMATRRDGAGVVRVTHIDVVQSYVAHEGVSVERVGGVPRITITTLDGRGGTTSTSLDLTRADLLHLSDITKAMADGMDGEV